MSKDANNNKSPEPADSKKNSSPGFWAIVLSTVAAAFGVQSQNNYQRDFKKGNIWVYIASGIVFTAVFILMVASMVSLVLENRP